MTDEPRPTKRVKSEAQAPRAVHTFDVDNCYLTPLKVQDKDGNRPFIEPGAGLAFCEATGQLALSTHFCVNSAYHGLIFAYSLTRETGTGTPSFVKQWEFPRWADHAKPLSVFNFWTGMGDSGALAFTEDGPPLLLVTDHGNDAVHVLDPAHGSHQGHLVPPGTIVAPRGVSTQGSMVAVSFWKTRHPLGDSGVALFQRSGERSWTQLWSVTPDPLREWYKFHCPNNVRISRDGKHIAVCFDEGLGSVLLLSTRNGGAVDYLSAQLGDVWDMDECHNGWLVSHQGTYFVRPSVYFVGAQDHGKDERELAQASLPATSAPGPAQFTLGDACALVLVPGLGLVARPTRLGTQLGLYTTPDLVAMGAMSDLRVAWITVVVRGVFRRASAMKSR